MGLFDKKQELSLSEFREALKKAPSYIPGVGGKMFGREERIKLEKELFSRGSGPLISKTDYEKSLKELGLKKYQVKTDQEKTEIDAKIRFLKKLGGI